MSNPFVERAKLVSGILEILRWERAVLHGPHYSANKILDFLIEADVLKESAVEFIKKGDLR